MPRTAKGPRLWLRPARRGQGRSAVWIIKDGGDQHGTGCFAHQAERAQQKLAEHIARKYAPERRERDIATIPVADVLAIYLADVVPGHAKPDATRKRIERLEEFFGGMMLDEINGASCRAYVEHRAAAERRRRASERKQGTPTVEKPYIGGARRDLQDLSAAIGHHSEEGLHRGIVRVKLPDTGEPRQEWLSRAEVAKLVWTCHIARERQEGADTKKRPLRHLVRFLLLGAYTGSRPGVLLTAAWDRGPGRSWIDTDAGLFYRLPEGAIATTKRQPPVPIAAPLLRLLRRWKRQDEGLGYVVRFQGEHVLSVKTAMQSATRRAGMGDRKITAYTLRHTAGTWLAHKNVSIQLGARFLGTSPEVYERHYAHHSPAWLAEAAEAIGRRDKRVSVVETVVRKQGRGGPGGT